MCRTKKKISLPNVPSTDEVIDKSQKTTNTKEMDHKQSTKCRICNKIIANKTAFHIGEDAIYHKGSSASWMHHAVLDYQSNYSFNCPPAANPYYVCIALG